MLEGLPWACLPAAKPARLLAQPLACLPAAKPAHLLARPLACLPAASVLLLPSSAPSTQPLLHAASYYQCKQLMPAKPCFHFSPCCSSAALGSSRCLSRLSAARTCGLSGIACSSCSMPSQMSALFFVLPPSFSMPSQMSAWTRTYLIPNLECKSLKLTNETIKQIYNSGHRAAH